MRGAIREKVLKALSIVIVMNMAFGGFLGLMMVDEGPAQVASGYPITENDGDIIVDGTQSGSEELRIENVHFKQDGDIIIRNGGVCYINNAILEFLVDLDQSNRHRLIIDDPGSELYINNAKITVSTRDLENYENIYWFNSMGETGARFTRPILFNITATNGAWIDMADSELAYHGYLNLDDANITMRRSKTTHPFAPRSTHKWGVILRVTNFGEAILEDSRIESSPYLQGVNYNGGVVTNENITMYDYHKIVDSRLILMNTYLDINYENRYNPGPPTDYTPPGISAKYWPDDTSPYIPENNTNYKKRMLWIENSEAKFFGLTVNMEQTGNAIDPVYGHTALYIADAASNVSLYRWLVVKPLDNALVPVEGSVVQVTPISGPPLEGQIVGLNMPNLIPEVTEYLERTTDATITQNGSLLEGVTGPSGRVIFGVVSDIIKPDDMPNSLYVGRYNVTASYEDLPVVPWSVTYGNAGLTEYPFVTEDDNYFYFPTDPLDPEYMPPFNVRLPHPDLFGTFTTPLPSTLVNGTTLPINITVTNWEDPVYGGVDVFDVRVEIWDGNPDVNTSTRIGFKEIPSILYNTSETVEIDWTPTVPGVYTIWVGIDRDYTHPFNDNVIPELVETNNEIKPPPSIQVLRKSDLTIEEVNFDAPDVQGSYVVEGAQVQIQARITNLGGADAEFFNVTFYDGPKGGILIGEVQVTKLTGSGGQQTVSVGWVPTVGTHNITVVVDELDVIPELDEDNNELAKLIIVLSRPDLVPSVTVSPDPSFEGDALSIDISVTNVGQWNVTETFTLKVYDGDASGPTTLIDSYDIAGLDSEFWWKVPGNIDTVYFNFTRTAAYPPSDQYIWARVDTGGVVTEYDEGNNLQFDHFVVNPKPNLVVETDDIVFIPDAYPMNGTDVTIGVTVHNKGQFPVNSSQIPFYVEVRLDDPDTGMILATLTYNTAIPIDGSDYQEFVWYSAEPPGEHYIYAIVDTEDNVSETFDDDNTASARIILYEVPNDLIVNDTIYSGYLLLEGPNPIPYARDGFTLVEESGILTLNNFVFRVEGQLFDDEWNIVVRQSGTLNIEDDSLITSDGKHVNIYLYDDATLNIKDSTIDDMIDIIASDNSSIYISDNSIIEGDIYADSMDTTAFIRIINSTLNKELQYIGGYTEVELWGVYIAGNPADETVVTVANDAIVYVEWFLTVYVVDANNVPIQYANVNWSRSPPWSDVGTGESGADGSALYRLRGRNITADNVVIGIGNYKITSDFYSSVTGDSYLPDSPVNVWMTDNLDTTIYFSDVKPDLDPPLYIEWADDPPSVGDRFNITTWVNNSGSNKADNVYVTFSDTLATTGLPLTLYNMSIPAGGSWYINFSVYPQVAGLHTFSVHIDPDNISWEYEEGDNFNSTEIIVETQKADLEITTSDIWFTSDNPLGPDEFTEDDVITIRVNIHNIGETDAYPGGEISVRYSVEGVPIGIDKIQGVPAGGSRPSSFDWTGTSPPGKYEITVYVDIPNNVTETTEANNEAKNNITIRPKADLIVQSVEFDVSGLPVTSEGVPDTTLVTITATVRNIGGTDAEDVKVSFSDGDGGTGIPPQQTILSIPIGNTEEASVTWTATITPGLLYQVHSIYAYVSYPEESDYGNNKNFATINVTLRPDLTVDEIVFNDDSPFWGQNLVINATIKNIGGTSADNFFVSFWDGPPELGLQIQGNQGPITVGIGLTVIVQVTWANPENGSHDVYVVADEGDLINEVEDEDNNQEYKVIVVYSDRDLIVNDTNTPETYGPGENALEPLPFQLRGFTLVEESGVLTFEYTTFTVVQGDDYEFNIIVRNNGRLIIKDDSLVTTDGYLLRIYLYDDATLEIYDSIISSNVVEILAFDDAVIKIEESEINSFIKVESTTATVTLTATNSSISQAFINFGGNSYAKFTNVYTPNVLISDNAQLDVFRWLEVYVKNGAGGALPGAVVNITDFADNPIGTPKYTNDAKGMALYAIHTDKITADDVVTYFTFKVYAKYTYPPTGEDFFGETIASFPSYLVDPQDNVKEAVIPIWDLQPDLWLDPSNIIFYEDTENRGGAGAYVGVGELITVEAEITNSGTAQANNTVVNFYHEIDEVLALMGQDIINLAIEPDGGTRKASITWVPQDHEWGDGEKIWVKVDPYNDIAELNENNNENLTAIFIVLPPDLSVVNIRFDVGDDQNVDNTTEGQEVTIVVRIRNDGTQDAETANSITVAVYNGFPDADGDGKPDPGASPIDSGPVSGDLPPGESTFIELSWDTTGQIAGHILYAYVMDATDVSGFEIPDTKLANNNMSEVFIVYPRPDLKPYLITPEIQYVRVLNEDGIRLKGNELTVGQKVRLQATIYNDGKVYIPGINVTFYDGTPGDADTDQIGPNKTIALGPKEYINVTVAWTVDAAEGPLDLTVFVNEFREVPESDYTNNQMSETYNVSLPEIGTGWRVLLKDKYTVGDTINIEATATFTETGDGVPSVPYSVRIMNAVTGDPIGTPVTGTSNPVGSIVAEIDAPTVPGEYYVELTVTYGGVSQTLESANFEVEEEPPDFPWLLLILLIIVAVVAVLIVGVALAKFGMGRLVECGECGAFIPEGEKKCPKCGAVFETETARCSECGAWIPSKSKSCPECGAIFAGIEKDKKDYIERMKTQYMEYVDQYRDEAKKDLGEDMTDEQFMDWWKANPKYVGFEDWLAREEELRKGNTKNCPSCNTINPMSAAICFKCGTIFKTEGEEEEEGFIEEEAGPPPEVPAKAVPAEAAPKAAPPTVVPKKVVQPPKEGAAPPTVVPKKVVQAPPTVVPKKVIKKPPEEK